mgnify:FL=1
MGILDAFIYKEHRLLKFKTLSALFLLLTSLSHGSTILVLGDSFSAGYGMRIDQGWVNLLSEEISPKYEIFNASISGDTTQGGISRLPKLLSTVSPDYVIIELGGNDGLRGQPLSSMRENIERMIKLCIDENITPILFEMRIPPNYGQRYSSAFEKVYFDIIKKLNVHSISFEFEKLLTEPGMIQSDGMHPTSKAQDFIKSAVKESLKDLIHDL